MNFEMSKEEAKAIVRVLSSNWIPMDIQKIVYDATKRLENQITKEED
jgi:hypothetical protein